MHLLIWIEYTWSMKSAGALPSLNPCFEMCITNFFLFASSSMTLSMSSLLFHGSRRSLITTGDTILVASKWRRIFCNTLFEFCQILNRIIIIKTYIEFCFHDNHPSCEFLNLFPWWSNLSNDGVLPRGSPGMHPRSLVEDNGGIFVQDSDCLLVS